MILLHYNSKSKNGKNGGSKIIKMVENLWGHGRYVFHTSIINWGTFTPLVLGEEAGNDALLWRQFILVPCRRGFQNHNGNRCSPCRRSPLNKEFKIDISA